MPRASSPQTVQEGDNGIGGSAVLVQLNDVHEEGNEDFNEEDESQNQTKQSTKKIDEIVP